MEGGLNLPLRTAVGRCLVFTLLPQKIANWRRVEWCRSAILGSVLSSLLGRRDIELHLRWRLLRIYIYVYIYILPVKLYIYTYSL